MRTRIRLLSAALAMGVATLVSGTAWAVCTPNASDGIINVKRDCSPAAAGDGAATHDDTDVINAAIAAAATSPLHTVFLPMGRYYVSCSINVRGQDGLVFRGAGLGTMIEWHPSTSCAARSLPTYTESDRDVRAIEASSTGILDVRDTRDSRFESFQVYAATAGADAGILIASTGSAHPSHGLRFEQVDVGANGLVRLLNGVQVGGATSSTVDVDNGGHSFEGMNMWGVAQAAMVLYGVDSTGNTVANSFAYPTASNSVGVAVMGAGLTWQGGGGGTAVADVDFYIASRGNEVLIEDGTWERTTQFMRAPAATGATPITVVGSRIANEVSDGSRPMFDLRVAGPVSMTSDTFGSGSRDQPNAMRWTPPSGGTASFDFSNNIVGTSLTTWSALFPSPSAQPTARTGTQSWHATGGPQPLPFFSGGDGTPGDPYQVATPEDLFNVNLAPSASFVQTADIDMTNRRWSPATGANTSGYGPQVHGAAPQTWDARFNLHGAFFDGEYDGRGHTITNLRQDVYSSQAYQAVGLFGHVGPRGRVHDLTLDGACLNYTPATVSAATAVAVGGGIAGLNFGDIRDVTVRDTTLYGNFSHSGGIVGINVGTVTNAVVDGCNIMGYGAVGGAAGAGETPDAAGSRLTRVVVRGSTISGFGADGGRSVGGLVGRLDGSYQDSCHEITGADETPSSAAMEPSITQSAVVRSSVSGLYAGGIVGVLNEGRVEDVLTTARVNACNGGVCTYGGVATTMQGSATALLLCATMNRVATAPAYAAGATTIPLTKNYSGRYYVSGTGTTVSRASVGNTADGAHSVVITNAVTYTPSTASAGLVPYDGHTTDLRDLACSSGCTAGAGATARGVASGSGTWVSMASNGYGASTPATGVDFGGAYGLSLVAPAGLASTRYLPGAF